MPASPTLAEARTRTLGEREFVFMMATLRALVALTIDSLLPSSMPDRLFAARPVNQNAPHRLGRRREEVPAPVEFLIADQSEIGFVNQCGRLQ